MTCKTFSQEARGWFTALLAAAAFVLAASPADAQTGPIGSGPNPNLPAAQHISITPTPVPGTTGVYEYHLEGLPLYFDPSAGPIVKWLIPPPTGWNPQVPYTLHEEIKLVQPPTPGNLPPYRLRDWHERIIPELPLPPTAGPAGQWLTNPAPGIELWTMDATGGMLQRPVPGLQGMVMGSDIWFTFDPIAPAANPNEMVALHIWKTFQVNPALLQFSPGPIGIVEWPTIPEPTSLILAGLGCVAAAGLRRRRIS